MARVRLGTLLYPSQTVGDVCEFETDNCMRELRWGLMETYKGKNLLRANFHSAKVWEKTTNENLLLVQQLHHNVSQHTSLTEIRPAD